MIRLWRCSTSSGPTKHLCQSSTPQIQTRDRMMDL